MCNRAAFTLQRTCIFGFLIYKSLVSNAKMYKAPVLLGKMSKCVLKSLSDSFSPVCLPKSSSSLLQTPSCSLIFELTLNPHLQFSSSLITIPLWKLSPSKKFSVCCYLYFLLIFFSKAWSFKEWISYSYGNMRTVGVKALFIFAFSNFKRMPEHIFLHA